MATALPALKSSSFISLGQLCDDNCIVFLNKNKVYAIKEMKCYFKETGTSLIDFRIYLFKKQGYKRIIMLHEKHVVILTQH